MVGAAIIRVLLIPLPFNDFLRREHVSSMPVERISFLALPKTSERTVLGKAGGNGRPVSATQAPPLVAPAATPEALPTPPAVTSRVAAPDAGTGPVVGTGGPGEGVRPEYHDPRVWVPAAPLVSAPKSVRETVDSAIEARVEAHNDTLALGARRRQPGDWTFEHNGKKYGIDSKFIRLGPVSIPTAVLAALPLNVQANPILGANERTLTTRHDEIAEQAQRAINEDEFRDAVRKLRQRKERERQDSRHQPPPPPDQKDKEPPIASKDGGN